MSEQEMRLLIMLSELNLDLDTITMGMLVLKEKENGYREMIEYLENKKEEINSSNFLRKVTDIIES